MSDTIDPRLEELVRAWEASPKQRGRPTCPCGYASGTKKILAHRQGCHVWRYWCGMLRREMERSAQ